MNSEGKHFEEARKIDFDAGMRYREAIESIRRDATDVLRSEKDETSISAIAIYVRISLDISKIGVLQMTYRPNGDAFANSVCDLGRLALAELEKKLKPGKLSQLKEELPKMGRLNYTFPQGFLENT